MIHKKIMLLFLFVVFTSVLFVACTETTTEASETTTNTAVSTTSNTTTQATTNTTTTTTNTTTQTTTTEVVNEEKYEYAEELYISINRLDQAVFDIDFSQAFSEKEDQNKASYYKQNFFPFFRILSSGNEFETYDNEDYLQHPYWQHYFYHMDLFEIPALDNGMYRFVRLLNSYNDLALNNLYTVGEGVSSQAQDLADWAVENIRVVNTWVEQGTDRYLLDYDDVNDIVNLYIIMDLDYLNCMSYRKISIYYNDIGEEVIEMWINEFYTDESNRKVAVYYNSVAARDFNYYNAELNPDLSPFISHFRGVNLGNDGMYHYYDNSYNYISGEVGWYEILPYIDFTNSVIDFYDYVNVTAYSPDAASDVIRIMGSGDYYTVQLFLPAFNGVDALLIEEDGLITANVDSQSTIDFLISQEITPLPDYYGFGEEGLYVTGIQTANGRFLSSDPSFQEKVSFQGVRLSVAPEGDIEYMNYHKYLGTVELRISESNLQNVLQILEEYINTMGLDYKYGALDQLFYELRMVEQNKSEILRNVSFVSSILNFDRSSYEDFASFIDARNHIFNYIIVSEEIIGLGEEFPTIPLLEQPTDTSIDSTNLINLSDKITGLAVVDESGIDCLSISVTIPATPILRLGQEYSIYYSLVINNKIHIVGMETPKIYEGSALIFDLELTDALSFLVPDGTYVLSIFLGKTTLEGATRISNVIPIPVEEFAELSYEIDDSISSSVTVYKLTYYSDMIIVDSKTLDLSPPVIGVQGYQAEFSGINDELNPMEFDYGSNVIDLLSHIIYVIDDVDGFMTLNYTNVYLDEIMTESMDQMLVPGIYSIIISDSSENITVLKIPVQVRYRIEFITDGGTEIYPIYILENADLIAPDDPVKDGFIFDGWYIDPEFTTVFAFDNMPAENITLFAKWLAASE